LALHAGDAYPGVLTISARRVSFMPIMESMASDIEPWSIPISELEEVEMGGFEGILTVTTDNRVQKIMGIDLERVRDALVNLIDGEMIERTDSGKTLIKGPIDIYTSGVLVASGEVHLTNEVFEFRQGRGLEELIWGDLNRVIKLEDIERCEVVGVRRRLEVVTAGETIHFRGPIVSHLYSVMATLGVGSSNRLEKDLINTWQASLYTGPIAQKGEIGMTEGTFRFTPTGMIESLLGVRKEVEVDISHIKRVAIIGVLDKRLVVSTRGSRVLNFQVNKPKIRLQELGQLMIKSIASDEPAIPANGTFEQSPAITALFEKWGSRIGEVAKDKLLIMGSGVDAVGQKSIRRGWVVLTEKQLVFIPSCGGSKIDEPLVAGLKNVSKAEGAVGQKGQVSLLIGTQKFNFIPTGGKEFVYQFNKHLLSVLKSDRPRVKGAESTPTGTGLVNRRETYRAVLVSGLPLQLSIGGLDSGGSRRVVAAKLHDVSLGGCSIITDESLPPRIELSIEFDIEGQRVAVNGRTIYSIRLGRKKIRWRHGVVFLDMGYGDAQCIRELVMGLQREEIVQGNAERENQD
jgi:hypothetical protein